MGNASSMLLQTRIDGRNTTKHLKELLPEHSKVQDVCVNALVVKVGDEEQQWYFKYPLKIRNHSCLGWTAEAHHFQLGEMALERSLSVHISLALFDETLTHHFRVEQQGAAKEPMEGVGLDVTINYKQGDETYARET